MTGIARLVYIGGVVANTPGNMVSWIRNPRALAPKTAMPNLGVGYDDAVDIASYLYTLRERSPPASGRPLRAEVSSRVPPPSLT